MTLCECGCGQASAREFLPGHDQKLRTALESKVGGVLALRELVMSAASYVHGGCSEAQFLQEVRAIFAKTKEPGIRPNR